MGKTCRDLRMAETKRLCNDVASSFGVGGVRKRETLAVNWRLAESVRDDHGRVGVAFRWGMRSRVRAPTPRRHTTG